MVAANVSRPLAVAGGGAGTSDDAMRAKLIMVQHAIAQLNDDIQTTRAKYASKQTEMEMLMRCVVGTPRGSPADGGGPCCTSGDTSTIMVRGQRKTVSFVHGDVSLSAAPTACESSQRNNAHSESADALGPLHPIDQEGVTLGEGCAPPGNGLGCELLRRKRTRSLELNIDGPLSPSRNPQRPQSRPQPSAMAQDSTHATELSKRPIRRLIAQQPKSTPPDDLSLTCNSFDSLARASTSFLGGAQLQVAPPHAGSDGPRVHLHHIGPFTEHTPLSSRNVNIDRGDAVGRKCGSGPSTFLNDMVVARRALARASIVLAGGDTELLDL